MTPDELKKKLEEQEDFYGDDDESSISGSAPDPEKVTARDTEGNLEDVIGNEPDEDEDGFHLADEVMEDERDIQDKPINDYSASDDGDDGPAASSDDDDDDEEPATKGPLEHMIEQEDK